MKIKIFLLFIFCISSSISFSDEVTFDEWLVSFKNDALDQGISNNTLETVLSNAEYLPNVIKYDRYQPEFYEDTKTYVTKRTSNKKLKNGITLYLKNKEVINNIETKFNVEKELLLALMGIETNFGKYLGKMDIISSLATLSFDKRRSAFFTNELITILKLIDNNIIDYQTLYGSWAGAFGNFQFMPTTIKQYALDYDKNNQINLKSIEDSFASAANYISSIGWKNENPCFIKVNLNQNVPIKYLNTSAKKISFKNKFKFFKKYIDNPESINIDENLYAAIVTPDKDIVPDSEILNPAFIVFNNYELILKWNRSLRFALAVCTLKNNFKNEL
ncbi:MAG: lytic transglycosylase domain-containing protein [Candidatus Pelagibacter sp.]